MTRPVGDFDTILETIEERLNLAWRREFTTKERDRALEALASLRTMWEAKQADLDETRSAHMTTTLRQVRAEATIERVEALVVSLHRSEELAAANPEGAVVRDLLNTIRDELTQALQGGDR